MYIYCDKIEISSNTYGDICAYITGLNGQSVECLTREIATDRPEKFNEACLERVIDLIDLEDKEVIRKLRERLDEM